MTAAQLMLAGGTGRLVRRPSVILFDPTNGHQDLAGRFVEAADDVEALHRVKKHLIDSGFSAAPLVAVSWDRHHLDLLIFGDVAIHSSAIAAPMVSGAGSASWVERHVGEIERGSEPTVELWSGDDADPTTNLELGVVGCAGFRLALAFSAPASAHVSSSPAAAASPAQPVVNGSVAAKPEVPEVAEPAASEPVVEEAVVAESVVAEAAVSESVVAEAVVAEAVVAEDAAKHEPMASVPVGASAGGAGAELAADRPVNDMVPAAEDDPTTGDTTGAEVEDPFTERASEQPARVGLIEAAHCQQGHPNPPRSAACYRCGISLIDDQSLSLIDQPSVGRIVFPGGQSVQLDRDMELGRKPTPPTGVHPVIIDHAEVSRSHASLTVEGWKVLVTDKGSRNGTWIVPPNDVTPVRLEAEVAHVLEHGSRVHLGGPEVAFTYLFDAEDS